MLLSKEVLEGIKYVLKNLERMGKGVKIYKLTDETETFRKSYLYLTSQVCEAHSSLQGHFDNVISASNQRKEDLIISEIRSSRNSNNLNLHDAVRFLHKLNTDSTQDQSSITDAIESLVEK